MVTQRFYVGAAGLVVAGSRVVTVFSPGRLRLLLALEEAAGPLSPRAATRAIWADHQGPLTSSQRASAARAITRLVWFEMVTRGADGLALTDHGRKLLKLYRAPIAEVLRSATAS